MPFLKRLFDTLLPPSCLVCDAEVEDDGQFCAVCFRDANFLTTPFCLRCGVPLPYEAAAGEDGICARCTARPPAFAQARAVLRYDMLAQRLLLPFKYADRPEAARGIARLMRRPGAAMLAAADFLVPVPLHRTRLGQRRYNQAALLARELARAAGKPVLADALIRARPTAPLEGMGRAARARELAGAIGLRSGISVHGRHVLLIDDVMTSGATAHECALVLRANGARRVDVLTAARVADPHLG